MKPEEVLTIVMRGNRVEGPYTASIMEVLPSKLVVWVKFKDQDFSTYCRKLRRFVKAYRPTAMLPCDW